MAQVPTGSTFQLYTSLSTTTAVTAISNATEAVVSAAGHTFVVGDFVIINSGWGRLNQRAYRVKSVVATTSFVLEGANTTSLSAFPAGGGAGTAQKALTPVQLTQVITSSSSGGEAKKVTYKYVESEVEFTINDGFTPVSRTMEIDADALGSPGYVLLQSLTDTQAVTLLKTTTRNGSFTLTPCTVALNEEVIFTDGQINRVRVDISGTNRSTRYAA